MHPTSTCFTSRLSLIDRAASEHDSAALCNGKFGPPAMLALDFPAPFPANLRLVQGNRICDPDREAA
jgi:hypothetical protein